MLGGSGGGPTPGGPLQVPMLGRALALWRSQADPAPSGMSRLDLARCLIRRHFSDATFSDAQSLARCLEQVEAGIWPFAPTKMEDFIKRCAKCLAHRPADRWNIRDDLARKAAVDLLSDPAAQP